MGTIDSGRLSIGRKEGTELFCCQDNCPSLSRVVRQSPDKEFLNSEVTKILFFDDQSLEVSRSNFLLEKILI
jgi:hypothetical protein